MYKTESTGTSELEENPSRMSRRELLIGMGANRGSGICR